MCAAEITSSPSRLHGCINFERRVVSVRDRRYTTTIPHAERTGSGGRYQLPGTFDPLLTSHFHPCHLTRASEKPGEIGLSAAPWKNPMESFRRTTGKLDNGLSKHWVMDDVARFGTRLRPEPRIKKPNASF
ncbi:hypothetical protein Bbelb_437760 [Branchiostoma belcheri]|nr:hypothetical protein Bbelb_437760 [Branchiostoma belcheri]